VATTLGRELEVVVNVAEYGDAPSEMIEAAVHHALQDGDVKSGEVSVTLLGDDAIRVLNRDYLAKDRPTDVIAFSLGDSGDVMGDVYVGAAQAERQARELGVEWAEELVRLAIHGTLHVLGHDHPEGPERTESPMFLLQERLVREILGRS